MVLLVRYRKICPFRFDSCGFLFWSFVLCQDKELCSGTSWRDKQVQYIERRSNAGEDCVTYGFTVTQVHFKPDKVMMMMMMMMTTTTTKLSNWNWWLMARVAIRNNKKPVMRLAKRSFGRINLKLKKILLGIGKRSGLHLTSFGEHCNGHSSSVNSKTALELPNDYKLSCL
jgi:hypothetical protein